MNQECNRGIKIRSLRKPLPISILRLFCFHLFENVQKIKNIFKMYISGSSWIIKYYLLVEIPYHPLATLIQYSKIWGGGVGRYLVWEVYQKNMERLWACKVFSWLCGCFFSLETFGNRKLHRKRESSAVVLEI